MNKQRKVLITITYNEMGIIIDTKTEELGSSAQPEKRTEKRTETHCVCLDTISRQAAQRLFGKALTYKERIGKLTWTTSEVKQWIADCMEQLPPAQPDCAKCKSELANKIRGQQDNPGMLTENDKGRNWGLEWAAQIVEGKRR